MAQQNLLELPTSQLMDKFGAGTHMPGSGSAAALMGILSCKLTGTVCKLSLKKATLEKYHRRLRVTINQLDNDIEPTLQKLFQKDAEVFDSVIKARKKRDSVEDIGKKREYRREELSYLREATEIPLEIGKTALKLIDIGIYTFDYGFKAARGDSGCSVSAAIAAVTSAIFVIQLNMKSFGDSNWKLGIENASGELLSKLHVKQEKAFTRITKLSDEEVKAMDLDLSL